ncbi:U3 snoRNP protein [Teratosphaeriaceae sp. CCFEE 6253]|nr:U3 snoRNP protein [Teratosphaeriaceae sp. CCFEE 6253]
MLTTAQFTNLLGSVYRRGNLVYTEDGTCLLSPVGNRVTVFDLINNKSHTLPFAHRLNVARIALHPRGQLLLTVDESGQAILSHFPRRIVLYRFSLKGAVSALRFSPSGAHFAVALGRKIEVWKTPSVPGSNEGIGDEDGGGLEFAPFVRYRQYVQHHDTVQSIEWSSDSRFFLSASKDLTARIWSLDPEEGFTPTVLAGHRTAVHAAWFSHNQETIYTISKDGALFRWQFLPPSDADPEVTAEQDERWRISDRQYFFQEQAHLTSAAFHAESDLLVAGFSNGLFMLHDLPGFSEIHKLSISASNIDTVSINKSGEWLAFGSSALGQLLVWEWQSESYILKQQGHFDSLNALTYSPSGDRIITCADDGKIKVWDASSGFCVVTFTEHSSGVTACEFARRGNVLFTASLDGSVRAFDLIRYRCFRTFTAPKRLSFSSIAVDPAGEVVAAGSLDDFDIHVWSVQTGQLLDQLSGHEGPVSSLAFSPNGSTLISGSWDRTVRLWSVFARTQTSEPLQLQADVLCVSVRPDSKQIAISTLDGQLTFWSLSDSTQEAGLDGRRDVSGGRKATDRRTAANIAGTKSFNTIMYSADGSVMLAGGNSKYICLYAVETGVMLQKYTVSSNLSLEGTQEFLNSRLLTEAGPRALLDEQGEASDLEDRMDTSLPGSKRGDAAQRKTAPEVRISGIAFSPTGRAFCAASTEGLLVYSVDAGVQFDPFDLDVDVTPETTLKTLVRREWLKALVMAFRLNHAKLVTRIHRSIPTTDIGLVVRDLPEVYLERLLRHVAKEADISPHLELNLLWLESLLRQQGRVLKERQGEFAEVVRLVQRAVAKIQGEIMKVADQNTHTIEYLLGQPRNMNNGGSGLPILENKHAGAGAADDDGGSTLSTFAIVRATMDDLLGEDWQAPTNSKTTTLPIPVPFASNYSSLRASPQLPISGAVSPQLVSRPSSTVNGSAKASDTFSSLLSLRPQKAGSSLTIQERQKQLLEEKRRQQEEHAQLWETLGSGRGTPEISGPSPSVPSAQADGDDILAAFNKAAPVDNASHYPPPGSAAVSGTSTPALASTSRVARTDTHLRDEDYDTFGLGSLPKHGNGHATAPVAQTQNDYDDILGDLSRPVSARPPQTARHPAAPMEADSSDEDVSDSTDVPHGGPLSELMDMGFSVDTARIALAETGGDVQNAVGWLLQQAHEESRQKVRKESGQPRQRSPVHDSRGPPRRQRSQDGSVPAWMRQEAKSGSAPRREDSRSPANGERDPAQIAQELSSKLFKGANSIWKASQKQMARTVADF